MRRNLDAKVGLQSIKGGTVYVGFTIDTSGKIINVFIKKSVEYVLNEEAKRLIEKSSDWKPAFQDGRALKRIETATNFFCDKIFVFHYLLKVQK